VDKVELKDGIFSANDDSATFAEAAEVLSRGKPIAATANVQPKGVGAGFGTHIVDVEVDTGTCKVQILRYMANQDVGRAIHPMWRARFRAALYRESAGRSMGNMSIMSKAV